MIRLDLPREPHWLDLPHGVRLLVRPLDTATDAAGRRQGLLAYGSDQGCFGSCSWTTHDSRLVGSAAGRWHFGTGHGKKCGTADGDPQDRATAFLRLIYAPLDRLAAEGEDCGAGYCDGCQNSGRDCGGQCPYVTRGLAGVADRPAQPVVPGDRACSAAGS